MHNSLHAKFWNKAAIAKYHYVYFPFRYIYGVDAYAEDGVSPPLIVGPQTRKRLG